ncbi:hypothetical protein JQ633_28825 [Bradyrhizobium tropiciagri]|uniref:hypothetical protein n=1 Tax=Bradyrhizobium tropiciagri TaxID=312253 RepID=UPI001BA6A634|nr:hypothetical protein [Bradyrhizobium tropiciagri]MBR0874391.1 hypothetical protein [Bradyrhizobium tropiciagri]
MPFIIKVGSLTVVARTASDGLRAVERFLADGETSEPVISTFEGKVVDITQLRRLVVATREP